MVAGARLFEQTFAMPYSSALWLGAAATIIYVFIGGFLAVSWADTVQATLMIFALILTPVMVLTSLGGFDAAIADIKSVDPKYIDVWYGTSAIGIISLLS